MSKRQRQRQSGLDGTIGSGLWERVFIISEEMWLTSLNEYQFRKAVSSAFVVAHYTATDNTYRVVSFHFVQFHRHLNWCYLSFLIWIHENEHIQSKFVNYDQMIQNRVDSISECGKLSSVLSVFYKFLGIQFSCKSNLASSCFR